MGAVKQARSLIQLQGTDACFLHKSFANMILFFVLVPFVPATKVCSMLSVSPIFCGFFGRPGEVEQRGNFFFVNLVFAEPSHVVSSKRQKKIFLFAEIPGEQQHVHGGDAHRGAAHHRAQTALRAAQSSPAHRVHARRGVRLRLER